MPPKTLRLPGSGSFGGGKVHIGFLSQPIWEVTDFTFVVWPRGRSINLIER